MQPELSQRTLGLLRDILEEMEPEDTYLPYESMKFWRDALFDSGLSPAVIDIASTYNFEWSRIIPDLFVGKFGDQHSHFSNALPPYVCEQTLKQLLAFALSRNTESPGIGAKIQDLRRSLTSDGFDLHSRSEADTSIPAELERIPSLNALRLDLKQKLDANELVSVLFMDLDGFKNVNDQLNHAEGDKCLIRVAGLMAAAILHKGKLYRRGGDEFVAVLPNFNRGEAASTAERIRAAIENDNPGREVKVTVSIGVASSESAYPIDADVLITLADATMYEAKKTRNCVAVADACSS